MIPPRKKISQSHTSASFKIDLCGVFLNMNIVIYHYSFVDPLQPINYEGFKLFMETYLDVDMPEDLCRHLFLSFVKKTPSVSRSTSREKERGAIYDVGSAVATVTTTAACAAITGSSSPIEIAGQTSGGNNNTEGNELTNGKRNFLKYVEVWVYSMNKITNTFQKFKVRQLSMTS